MKRSKRIIALLLLLLIVAAANIVIQKISASKEDGTSQATGTFTSGLRQDKKRRDRDTPFQDTERFEA